VTIIENYYDYSILANAAYINLDGKLTFDGTLTDVTNIVLEANEQNRIPTTLAEQLFDSTKSTNDFVWSIPTNGYSGNDSAGYAATLFEKGNEKVLAIRGTEPGDNFIEDLLKADLAQIGFIGFALDQTVSMINHILRLKGSADSEVPQFEVIINDSAASGGIPIDDGAAYISFNTNIATGLGLIGPDDKITVTGHSLGGHLAAMAARLFPDTVEAAYVYNAPGFDSEYSTEIAVGLSLLTGPNLVTLASLLLTPKELKLTDEFINFMSDLLPSNSASSFSELPIYSLESEDLAPGDDLSIVSSIITNQQAYGITQNITIIV